MINLAGDENCDKVIKNELILAKIELVKDVTSKGEVPYTIEGKLGEFRFKRYWYYWVVTGPMPIEIANELYKDPVGKQDIRAGGHCGCVPPNTQASNNDQIVNCYHIDSQVGLRLFADTIRNL